MARCAYEIQTLVQHYSMPIGLAKRDLMACAQTGSEKTPSFLLPVVCGLVAAAAGGGGGNEGDHRDRVAYDRAARSLALVLALTRDLAAQVLDAKSLIWSKIDIKHKHKSLHVLAIIRYHGAMHFPLLLGIQKIHMRRLQEFDAHTCTWSIVRGTYGKPPSNTKE